MHDLSRFMGREDHHEPILYGKQARIAKQKAVNTKEVEKFIQARVKD